MTILCTSRKEEIADLEAKPALTDDDRTLLDHIAGKLQMYDGEFHKHHYRLIDNSDGEVELEEHQTIFHDHGRKMMSFFKRMTNLRSQKKIVTTPPRPAEETVYIGAYNSRLQLITSLFIESTTVLSDEQFCAFFSSIPTSKGFFLHKSFSTSFIYNVLFLCYIIAKAFCL